MSLHKWTEATIVSILANCFLQIAANAATPESISKAITSAKILAPGYKVSAAIYQGTHEVIVSTYANSASRDVVTDCKIDALLIARTVIETSTDTIRVKVRFYQADQATYREVVINKAEIAAFSSGATKKDEMLESLEVQNVGVVPVLPVGTVPISTPTATAALRPTDKLSVYRKNGLMFYYPKSWGAKEMSNQWGDFVEFFNNRTSWASIIFRLQDKDSAEQTAADDDRYYWSSHQIRIVQQPKTSPMGYGKNMQALIYYLKDSSNPKETDRYEKHVYFGYKHRIYSLSVRFCKQDYESVNADLNMILNTMIRE